MRLRSIPPANQRPNSLARLSSMQAATRIGFTFVGASKPCRAEESGFKPRVIVPDPEARRQREVMREAVAQALASNASFWAEELAQWSEEFGEARIRQLRERHKRR